MRISHILHQYMPDKVGGTELYTRTLAQHLVQRGHDVSIATPSPSSNTLDPQIEEGVQIYRIPIKDRGATTVFLNSFRQPSIKRAYQTLLQKEPPDLVHIEHLMGWPLSILPIIEKAHIPYIITLHDYWHLCPNSQLLTNFDETICKGPEKWLNCAHCALARSGYSKANIFAPGLIPLFAYRHAKLRNVLQGAKKLIAPTQFTKTIHTQMGINEDKIQVVPHGIRLPAAMPPHAKQADFHIGYIGGLAWQKGVHVLVEAVNQLPQTGIQLSIIGDTAVFPEYVAHLQTIATHPGIQLQGRLPPEQLWQALAKIDVLVVPSLWYETAALVIQEAFAAGVPVIASRIGALQERLEDGRNGRFVPPGDASSLAEILHTFHQHPEELQRLRQGIQPVRTIEEHVTDIETIYQQSIMTI